MIFKVILLFVYAVFCEAQLLEGESCYKAGPNGGNGVCIKLGQCRTALGELKSYGKNPQICSFDHYEPVVCCLDAKAASRPPQPPPPANPGSTFTDDDDEGCEELDSSMTPPKTGQKAFDKCIEYQEKYVYPCEAGVSFLGDLSRGNYCHHNADELIIGGVDAAQYEFPHMVMLGFGNLSNIKYECGGAIISENFILTAGHCIASKNLGPVTHIVIGALRRRDASDQSKIYKVKNIIKHPQYKSPVKYNEIALLETEKRMALDQFTVPACLHTGDVVDDSRVLAAGWGLTHNGGKELSETLKKVILTKFSTQECTRQYRSLRLMKRGFEESTQTCYGDKGQPQEYYGKLESKDTCQGDSGGPIQIKSKKIHCMYTVVGVTSFGKECGHGDKPGLYTRVSHYVPWIESIVWP